MGVKGLWRLLLPIGRRISIETLHGKILAIDASIWLVQFLKAVRDVETGEVAAAAHLQGFFRRICRLQFHGIRPVFVFDNGATLEIKKRETANRRRKREQFAKLDDGALQRMARKILAENLKKQQQQQAVGKKKNLKGSGESGGAGGGGGGNRATNMNSNSAFAAGFNPGAQQEETSQEEDNNVVGDGDNNPESAVDAARALTATIQQPQPSQLAVQERQEKEDSSNTALVDLTLQEAAADIQKAEQPDETANDWDIAVAMAAAQDEQDTTEAVEQETEYEDFGVNDDWGNSNSSSNVKKGHETVNIQHIASLHPNKRKEAIEQAKRQLRLQSRKEFMPAAANPDDFSQVQLTNFLRSTHLNQSIVKMAVAAVEKDNVGLVGEVMASDRTTRVLLEREGDLVAPAAAAASPNRKRAAKRQLVKRGQQRHTFVHVDSESSEDEVDWEEAEDSKPAAVAGRPSSAKKARRVIQSDDSDSEGSDSDVEVVSHAQRLDRKPAAKPQPKRQVIHLDASDESDEEGCGFIRQGGGAGPKGAKEIVELDGDNENDSGSEAGGFLKADSAPLANDSVASKPVALGKPSADAVYAQELEDRLLAQALQQEEDAETGLVAGSAGRTEGSDEYLVVPEKEAGGGRLIQSPEHCAESQEVAVPKKNADPGSSDDESSVDWEDGDAVESRNGVAWEDGETSVKAGVTTASSILPSWEETRNDASSAESETDEVEIVGVQQKSPAKQNKAADLTSPQHFSAETTAALERAGETAGNLADWAGRAFKRAMREVNGPEMPSPLKASQVGSPTPRDESGAGQSLAGATQDDNSVQEGTATTIETRNGIVHTATSPPARVMVRNNDLAEPDTSRVARLPARSEGSGASQQRQSTEIAQSVIDDLERNDAQWTAERNQRARDMDTVTDEMKEEIIQLLQLFGIPYIEAPAEAEAQCAALEMLGLVDGIVTEDSDVFAFGGKTVYKNIFDDKKYAEAYLAKDAEKEMGLGRNSLVALALLLGGDYTAGVNGVGIVNSMEVLESFDVEEDLRGGLLKFRKWLDGFDPLDAVARKKDDANATELTKERVFHSKHRTARTRWVAPDNFPADDVLQAYSNPVVDKSTDRFSFGKPDVEKLVVFCSRYLGWNPEETKHTLGPVLKNMEGGYRQTRIDSFMTYDDGIKFADVRSKRLRNVLGLKVGASEDAEAENEKARKRRKK